MVSQPFARMTAVSADVRRRLGRGVIVHAGTSAPDGWGGAERVRVDDDVLRDPTAVVARLHSRWAAREPVVIEVAVDVAELRAPEIDTRAPCELTPSFEFEREHLYFLARSNNYDARGEGLVWGPGTEARRLGARPGGSADILLPDGTAAWIDGGPRQGAPPGVEGAVLHRVRVEHGDLTPDVDARVDADLAADQLRAVAHSGGPARIVAPAGSGKTRVLTERFRLLVARRGWGARPVCAVAYNVRAKQEMEQRLADVGAPALRKVRTLHALGFDAVRRVREIREVLSEWDVRRRIEPLVPIRPRANTDVYVPYLEALGEVRLGLVRPEAVEARRDDVEGFAAMFEEYRDRMLADGVVDHDEQIYGAIEVLCTDVSVRRALQAECRHLLVDEFQDLTPAQLLMLRLLAAPAYDVFGVGDDDQVIYGYTGADPAFLVDYERYFPGAAHLQLEVNYRCPAAIVDAAKNVLGYNRIRVPKQIRARKREGPRALMTSRHASEQLPAAALERVQRRLDEGAQPGEIAVLTRVRSALLGVQVMCADAGIPANAPIGREVLDRTGARAALAYLRLAIASPADALPGPDLSVAARRPSRSLRREVLQRIANRKRWTHAALRGFAEHVNGRLDEFLDDLARLDTAVRAGAETETLLRIVRDDIGLGGALDTLDRGGRRPEASHRDDLNALISVAALAPDPTAFEPWLRAHLDRPRIEPADGELTLSTVHRVKGMEWPHVVVLGVHDGLMPHHLADDVEEERRVFHVALTRASSTVHLIADATARNRFLAEADGSAPVPTPPATIAPRRPTVVIDQVGVGAADDRVFDALRAWRRDRAKADGVPAYVVLHDTHLQGIAARMPATLAELSHCPGIGPMKLERYGDEIVAVIADLAP
jgi:DNA helicase-2/ATP-dependent DNA helicase PcrA